MNWYEATATAKELSKGEWRGWVYIVVNRGDGYDVEVYGKDGEFIKFWSEVKEA